MASGKTVAERFLYPYVYQPGASWEYSSAGDWAGKLEDRLQRTTLTVYMKDYTWEPVGAKEIAFRFDERIDLQTRLADMSMRDPAGSGRAVWVENNIMAESLIDDMGGGGAFATPSDYMKIMQSLLKNNGRLLMPETVDQMFSP